MGGWGSGRAATGRRSRGLLRFDLAELNGARSGTLTYSCGGEPIAIMIYLTQDGPEIVPELAVTVSPFSYGMRLPSRQIYVRLVETATAFNGRRRWFACPQCSGRCRVLFGTGLRCRKCCRFAYASQSEGPTDRACRQMHKIRRRLNLGENTGDLPVKPKGMHWRTYDRLADRHANYEEQWAGSILNTSLFRRLLSP